MSNRNEESDGEFVGRMLRTSLGDLGDRLAWDKTEVARDIFVRRIAAAGGLRRDADQLRQEAQYAVQAAEVFEARLGEVVDTDD